MKFLIFRTDRIGDFIVTAILIKSIKQKYKDAKITVVSSDKNFDFISKFSLVNNVFLYPKNLKDKYLLIKKLNKLNFDYLLVVDGKKRSFFLSMFIKSKIKILLRI